MNSTPMPKMQFDNMIQIHLDVISPVTTTTTTTSDLTIMLEEIAIGAEGTIVVETMVAHTDRFLAHMVIQH